MWGNAVFLNCQCDYFKYILVYIGTTHENWLCALRHGLFSWYLWAKNPSVQQYWMVHLGRGYWAGHFEAECAAIIPRLWARYSTMPYMISDTIHIDESNKNDLEDWLARFLIAIGGQQKAGPRIPMSWHQRSFGSAQIPQKFQKNPPIKEDRASVV